MRKLLFVFLCLFSLASFAETVLKDNKGNSVQLSKLKDKWVVVNYWATWCGTCVHEIPELNRFYQKIKNDKNIVLYGVNYEGLSRGELNSAMSRYRVSFPNLVQDPRTAWHLEDTSVLPTTFIINPKGKVVKKIEGATTAQALMNIVNRHST